jgi:hypothetical protein
MQLLQAVRELVRSPHTHREEITVPWSALRAQNVTTATAGGFTTTETVGPITAALRNHSSVIQAGAQVFNLKASQKVPAIATGATAQWVSETGQLSLTDAAFSALNLSPRRVGVAVKGSSQWLIQSGEQAEQQLIRDMCAAIAYGLDLGALSGAGGVEPLGILENPAVTQTVTFGGAPSLATVCQFERKVADAFGEVPGRMAWFVSHATREKWRQIAAFPAVGGLALWHEGRVIDSPAFATPTIANADSRVAYGNFGNVVIAMFGDVRIIRDVYTYDKEGQVELVANLFADVGLLQPQGSFAKSTDSGAQ